MARLLPRLNALATVLAVALGACAADVESPDRIASTSTATSTATGGTTNGATADGATANGATAHASIASASTATATAAERAPFAHDAYVWQRAWTRPVVDAVRERGPRFAALRVLAAEIVATDRDIAELPARRAVVKVAVPPRALTGEVVLVVRIDGAVPPDAVEVSAVVDEALASFAAADVRGLEIDHDCATARLGPYAAMLAALRTHLSARSPNVPLSITALPAWSTARALDEVLAVVDEVVLQVHGVDRPEDGLFATDRARAFVDAFAPRAARADVAWRVALPAYGSALAVDDAGRVRAVESEEPRAVFGRAATGLARHEAWAEPADVAALLRHLEDARPRGLAGVVWFRLPVDGDRRAWSFTTLEAVRARADLSARFHVEVRTRSAEGPGTTAEQLGDIVVVNDGLVDAPAPARVDLVATALVAADGSNGFALDRAGVVGPRETVVFSSSRPPRIAPAGELVVGWVRAQEVTAHASP